MAKLIRTSLVTFVLPMWMRFGGGCKFLHHVVAGQVVAATAINDHATRMLFNDTLCLEQGVALIFLRFLHLCA